MSRNRSGEDRLERVERALRGDERFRLATLALARGDDEQAARLAASCAEQLYRLRDLAFVDRVDAARLLALVAVSEVARHVSLANLAESAAKALAWCADDGGGGDEQLEDAFEQRARRETALAATCWQAFGAVCDDQVGVEARVVVAATHSPPFLELHSGDFDRLDSVDPDRQGYDEWRSRLGAEWRHCTPEAP